MKLQPESAGKITGMLLELSETKLRAKVDEAVQVFRHGEEAAAPWSVWSTVLAELERCFGQIQRNAQAEVQDARGHYSCGL